MPKKLLITVLVLIGGFFVMEFLAPGHWEFFTEYVGKTVDAFITTWLKS